MRVIPYPCNPDELLEPGLGEGQVRAGYLAGIHALIQRYGGEPRRLLERYGLDPLTLADPDRYIDCAAAVRLLEGCAALFDDPLFGLRLGELQTPDVFGSVAVLARAAPTVREGLKAFIDYVPVIHTRAGDYSLALHSGAEFRWASQGEAAASEQATCQALLLNVKILQMLSGPDVRPDYVHLVIDLPRKDLVEIQSRLGRRIECRRPHNAIGFPLALLDRPVASANKLTYRLLGTYLKQAKAASAANLAGRVECYIRGAMPSGNWATGSCPAGWCSWAVAKPLA